MEQNPLKRLIRSPWGRAGLYLLLLLPVLVFRPLTPTNELKYLAIADEALRDGHFWCMYLDGALYADKPPFFFWIVMGCRQLLGCHCAAVLELFSLLPALAIMLLFGRWCSRYGSLSGRRVFFGELLMLLTAWFLGSAVVVRMDMLMTLFITLAFYTFWKIRSGDGRPADRWLFGLWVFLAVFSKGPVGFLMPFVCLLVYAAVGRDWRSFGQVWGWRTWLVLAALCGLWWFFAWREGGAAYLQELLGRQTFGRAVNAFHHKEPFYYYLYSLRRRPGRFLLAVGDSPYAVQPAAARGDGSAPAVFPDCLRSVFRDDVGLQFQTAGLPVAGIRIPELCGPDARPRA